MRLPSTSLLLGGLATLATLVTPVLSQSLTELATQLPECGLLCIQQAIPQSPCELTNSTCVCTDPTFAGLALQCVAGTCSAKEALTVQRIQNLGCGVPVESQQIRFKVHAIVACVLAEICVIVRIYSKLTILGKLTLDDYFILVAFFATIPYLYLHVTLADLGFGLNIWDIQPFANLYRLLGLFWIDQMMYSVHLYFTKLSILSFLLTIFPSRTFKNIANGVGIFLVLCFIATLITTALQCRPVSYNATSWDGESVGECNDLNTQTYAFGAINMTCDIILILMPIPELAKLQVKTRQKIQLFVMFGLGAVVTVFSIIRLPFLVSLGKTQNPTWEYVEVTIWSIWETELGMICASLPAIRHLFRTWFPNAMGTIRSKFGSYATKNTTNKSGSWGSRKDRDGTQNKDYYELDERSLIDNKGPSTTVSAAGGKA